ncbi:MAG: M3 family metallopeptidase [Bacteroidales bacterium]|nr:M3 family metallopeptidase [Bacteroidales bacterium]
MKHKLLILAGLSLALLAGCKHDKDMQNPFFSNWGTPNEIPNFAAIKADHYMPAFQEGMKQQKAAIDSIVNNPEAPTFENTILAYEYSGELLAKVSGVFFNLSECESSDEMDSIAEEVTPLLSAHADDIALNAKLFERIKTVYDNRNSLSLNPEQLRLVEETYKGFVRSGANIPAEKQDRFRQLNEQIASLTLRFAQNVLKATNAYGLDIDEDSVALNLGLTETQLDAAHEAYRQEHMTPSELNDPKGVDIMGYRFTLHMPSWEPFMQDCTNRALREEMWHAYADRCREGEFDNTKIIDTLVNLRLERANILGYKTHADYVLDDCLAKTPEAVYRCLNQIWTPALKKAKQERDEYQRMLSRDLPGTKLQPWDWRYYSERLRSERYAIDDAEVRPYFSLETVLEGAFAVANRLYGLSFVENQKLPNYNPEAHPFEVYDGDSLIGILYMDFHPRASKRSGAWMTEFRGQHRDLEGRNVIPVIQVVCNFTRPTADAPALLNFDESETLFHEFGHALHGLLSNCTYPSIAGTNVPRDFVEMPSQVMENWCRHPEVMKSYARHYQTGKAIPDELIAKIAAAQTYGQGFINTELLAASLLDMDYYTLDHQQHIEPLQFEEQAMQRIGLIPEIISRYRSPYFQHIFTTGYDAGYYSYTWTAILDADAFEAFRESGDLYNPELAARFRHLLESGNTADPMELYLQFRGKEPSVTPLLRNRGLL